MMTTTTHRYENLVMDCCENLTNDQKEKDEIIWTTDLSLCRLLLDEDGLTIRIFNHLGQEKAHDILDLRFHGENSTRDWKVWLEAISSNAATRPRISLGKNDPFERMITELEKQERKYQVRTSTYSTFCRTHVELTTLRTHNTSNSTSKQHKERTGLESASTCQETRSSRVGEKSSRDGFLDGICFDTETNAE